MIQINVCDTRWHAAFVLAELSFKRIRRYLCVRTYRIRATLMLLSLGFPYRLFFCFLIPLPVPSPLFFTPRLLSLSLLIVTFTPVDHCARYYACIIGFAGSSNGSEPTRFQWAPCAPRFSRFLPWNRSVTKFSALHWLRYFSILDSRSNCWFSTQIFNRIFC